MKNPFPIKQLAALGLIIGLALGFTYSAPLPGGLFAPTPTASPTAPPTPTLEPRTPPPATHTSTPPPQPFTTLPGAWMVRFQVFRNTAPEIQSLVQLSTGRLTVATPGENKLLVLDGKEQVMFEQSFRVEFLSGDPPKPVDVVTQIFILPVMAEAKTLVIQTPQGETRLDFPSP